MATIQHYIRGAGENSLSSLANLYKIDWKDIGNATFGNWGASVIYPWLAKNGGSQGAKGNVPTGYNWYFSVGMVVNIPGVAKSLSPVDLSLIPTPKPGGPLVQISGKVTPPPEPQQLAPDPIAYTQNENTAIAQANYESGKDSTYYKPPPVSQTSNGKQSVIQSTMVSSSKKTWLLAGGFILLLLILKKMKKSKPATMPIAQG